MSAPAKTPEQKPEAPVKLAEQLIEWARSALPAVLSAIGVSGLVSILGGAVLWARFNAAGLPANEAVGDQPTGSLIVTGAVSLSLYLVLGLLAVMIVYLLQGAVLSQVLGRPSSADPLGGLKREAKLIRSRISELEHDLTDAKTAADAQLKDLESLQKKDQDAGKAVGRQHGEPKSQAESQHGATEVARGLKDAKQLLDDRQARVKRLQEGLSEATSEVDKVARTLFDARSKSLSTRHYGNAAAMLLLVSLELAVVLARTTASWWEKGLLWGSLLLLAGGAVASVKSWDRADRDGPPFALRLAAVAVLLAVVTAALVDPWTLAPVAAALLLAVGCFAIGRLHPRRFFWLGVSTFASVALFGAVLTYSRDVNAPSAQAAAVLLKNGCAVQGLWIGESSERVFLARVDGEETHPREGRIFSLERGQVISESVGKLRRVPYATRQAAALRKELLATQAESVLTTSSCTASGQKSDYFAGSMSSFKGVAALHAETLTQPMCLVRYFDRRRATANGADPGTNWWTTCEYDQKSLGSVALVRQKLALPKAWGARDGRVTATIPAGTKVIYLSGIAEKQCEDSGARCYEGGGVQLLFHARDVNPAWLGHVECDEAAETAARYRFAACEL
jgi:hypothetical protein